MRLCKYKPAPFLIDKRRKNKNGNRLQRPAVGKTFWNITAEHPMQAENTSWYFGQMCTWNFIYIIKPGIAALFQE